MEPVQHTHAPLPATDPRAFPARFAGHFAAAASVFLRTDVIVRADTAPASPATAPARLSGAVLALGRIEGEGQVVRLEASAELARCVVSRLMGGRSGDDTPTGEPLTEIGQRIFSRLGAVAASALARAWPGTAPPLQPIDPAQELPGTASGNVIAFSVELEGVACAMWLHVPAGMLGPAPAAEAEPRAPRCPVELSAGLEAADLPADALDALREGDILATGLTEGVEVTLRIAGIPKYVARLGMHNGRRAVTILRRVDGAE